MLSGFENGRWEARVIRRIREMLSFEAESIAPVINLALLASNAIEEVPGVELEARLGRRHLEHPARMRLVGLRCERQGT